MNEDFRIEKQGSKTVLVRCYRDEETVKIPDGVTEIGERAFEDCRSLENITIPDSVTKIGKLAFSDCENLIFKCSKDSPAHKYAEKRHIKYELI